MRAQSNAPPPSCGSSSQYSSLSLAAMARIVSFFPDGVPLGFVAASPMARLAAETYRAEENYRWTANGLVRREPGERETFDTYEARRQRRAGVQLGRLISVYHDCVGRVPRCSEATLPTLAEVSVEAAVACHSPHSDKRSLAGVGLLAEEWHAKPLVVTPGLDRETVDVFEPVAASGGNLLTSGPTPAKTSTPLWLSEEATSKRPDSFHPTAICLEDGHRVFYFTGPNRRTLYLWMDTPVRQPSSLQVPDAEQMMTMTNTEEEGGGGGGGSSNEAVEAGEARLREEVQELVRRSRWWFQRPAVSSMRYLAEVYGKDSTLLPPPPPALYLHVYGQSPASIPVVCELLLTPPPPGPPPPPPSSAHETAGRDDEEDGNGNGNKNNTSRWPSPSSTTDSFPPPREDVRTAGPGYTVASPLPAAAVAQHELKNHQLEQVFGSRRSPWLSVHGAMKAGPTPGSRLARPCHPPPPPPPPQVLSHVTMPVLEGLFVIGYPLMSMRLVANRDAAASASAAAAAYERLHLPASARGEGSAGAAAGLRLGPLELDTAAQRAAGVGPLPEWLDHELLSGLTGEASPPDTNTPGRSGAAVDAPTAPPSIHSCSSSVTSHPFGVTLGLNATAPCHLRREWTNRLRVLKFHGVRFDDDGLRSFIGATEVERAEEEEEAGVCKNHHTMRSNGRGRDEGDAGRHSTAGRSQRHRSSVSCVNNCSTQALHDGSGGHHGRRYETPPSSSRPVTGRTNDTTDSPRPPSTLLSLRGGNTYKVALNPIMPFLEVCDIALSLELTVFPLLTKEGQSAEDNVVYSGIRLLPVISLRHLTLLHLQGTGIQQAVLDLIGLSCPALESLYLGSCPFLRNIEPLGLLPVLRRLDMHGTSLTDDGLDGVLSPWSFPMLEELSLAGCTAIHNVSALGHLKNLRLLDLRQVPIREGLSELRGCPRLEKLFFSSSLELAAQMEHRQPEWVRPVFLHHLHTLTHLTLENIPLFNHEGVEALAKARTGLRTLRLIHMLRLDSVTALGRVPTLETLHIEDAPLLMTDGLKGIGTSCLKLQSVQLIGCTLLEGLAGLAGAKALRYVEFTNGRDTVSAEMLQGLLHCRQGRGALRGPPLSSRPPRHVTGGDGDDAGSARGGGHHAFGGDDDVDDDDKDRMKVEGDTCATWASRAACPPLEVLRIPGHAQLDSLRPLVQCPASLSTLTVLDVSGSALDNVAVEQLATVSTAPAPGGAPSSQRRADDDVAEEDSSVSTATAAKLNALYLCDCKRLTKVNALMHLPALRVLDLSRTSVSDGGIGSLKAAPALEVLLLRQCTEMQFVSHTAAFDRLRVLYLSDNRRLNSRLLKQFFSFVDDCEEKLANPLDTPFRRLEELHLDGTTVDSIQPLIMLQQLRVLNAAGTSLRPAGIVHLPELPRLEVLRASNIRGSMMGGSLRPLFTHPSLQQLDLRGTTLDTSAAGAAAISLPVAVLAVSPIRELALSGRSQLPLLLPLLQHPTALPRLRRLIVEDGDFSTSDAGEATTAAALPPPVAALALPHASALKQEALRTHLDRSRLAAHRRAGGLTFAPPPAIDAPHVAAEEEEQEDEEEEQKDEEQQALNGFPCLTGESVEERLQRLHCCLTIISAARPLTSLRREMPCE